MSVPRDWHPIFCILLAPLLREIARNGITDQRDAALRTLTLDSASLSMRTIAHFLATPSQISAAVSNAAPLRPAAMRKHLKTSPDNGGVHIEWGDATMQSCLSPTPC